MTQIEFRKAWGALLVLTIAFAGCWCGNDGPPRPPKPVQESAAKDKDR